jgi:serine beta-lactamase-like protein LACTB, mitochondrial
MHLKAAIVIALLASPSVVAQPLSAATVKDIEQQVSLSMTKYHLPAASVAVVRDDQLVWHEAFGTADLENLAAATDASVFRLASVSKPITAVAVMQLVEAGRLQLDLPISDCVPQYKPSPVPTIRQILTHTSGVRHYRHDDDPNDPEFANTRHYTSVTASIDQFKNDPLLFPPGSSFSYSTHAFTLLGACVEQTTHTPFVPYVREHVFKVAGMSSSRDDDVTVIVEHRARPYQVSESGQIENAILLDSSNRIPGGGFISTAMDMARFALALFDGKLLRPETVHTMFTPILLNIGGTQVPIALGWAAGGSIGREDVVWMGGNQPGGTAMLFLIPRTRSAIVVLTNNGGQGHAVIELANGIAKAIGR